MATTIPDLWPADFGSMTVSPVAILREQGELLARKTQGAVRGEVRTVSSAEGEFLHTFHLRVPELGGYTYELFGVRHLIQFYPLRVLASCLPGGERVAATEKEYYEVLQEVFTHRKTRDLINALWSQVQPV